MTTMFGERKTTISSLVLAVLLFGCCPEAVQEQKKIPECVHMEKARIQAAGRPAV